MFNISKNNSKCSFGTTKFLAGKEIGSKKTWKYHISWLPKYSTLLIKTLTVLKEQAQEHRQLFSDLSNTHLQLIFSNYAQELQYGKGRAFCNACLDIYMQNQKGYVSYSLYHSQIKLLNLNWILLYSRFIFSFLKGPLTDFQRSWTSNNSTRIWGFPFPPFPL